MIELQKVAGCAPNNSLGLAVVWQVCNDVTVYSWQTSHAIPHHLELVLTKTARRPAPTPEGSMVNPLTREIQNPLDSNSNGHGTPST